MHTRSPIPLNSATPESYGAPAYVLYKVGGDAADCQFFTKPPDEIPTGYVCAYIPDNNQAVHTGQNTIIGASGTDAEKQAWLAKYATGGPSTSPSAPGT